MDNLRHELDLLGFSIVPNFLNPEEIDGLLAALSAVEASDAVRKKAGVYAIRNLLEVVPAVNQLATSNKLKMLVQSALGMGAFPVKATLFDNRDRGSLTTPALPHHRTCGSASGGSAS